MYIGYSSIHSLFTIKTATNILTSYNQSVIIIVGS